MRATASTTPCKLIGVAGGSGSGKTTLARILSELLGESVCAVLSQDHYYHDQSARFSGDGENVNFDHPSAIDFELLSAHLQSLKRGLAVEVPRYDFVTHTRSQKTETFPSRPIVLLDGTLILSQENIRTHLDISIFVETPEEIRFQRRFDRDVKERGREPDGIIKQFKRQVKPMHDEFVEPSKSFAEHRLSGVVPFESGMASEVASLIRQLLPTLQKG